MFILKETRHQHIRPGLFNVKSQTENLKWKRYPGFIILYHLIVSFDKIPNTKYANLCRGSRAVSVFVCNIVGSCHKLNHTFDLSVSISMTDRFTRTRTETLTHTEKTDRWDNSMCMGAWVHARPYLCYLHWEVCVSLQETCCFSVDHGVSAATDCGCLGYHRGDCRLDCSGC